MSQNDLTSARLRELIAAARCNASYCAYCGQPDGHAAQALSDYLDGNASALADAQDKADLLEWLGKSILNGWTFEWNPHQGMFEVLNDEGRYVAGSGQWIDALRAAKEASRG